MFHDSGPVRLDPESVNPLLASIYVDIDDEAILEEFPSLLLRHLR